MEALLGVKLSENKESIHASKPSGLSKTTARKPFLEVSNDSQPKSSTSSGRINQEAREKIERIAQVMDDYVRSAERSLRIQVHGGTGRIMVKVISKEDGRIIREIPPEQVLNLAARMEEMMGFLFDEKV